MRSGPMSDTFTGFLQCDVALHAFELDAREFLGRHLFLLVLQPRGFPVGGPEQAAYYVGAYAVKVNHARDQPRLSTKRGGFTAASNSRAIVPRGSSVTFGFTWNVRCMDCA